MKPLTLNQACAVAIELHNDLRATRSPQMDAAIREKREALNEYFSRQPKPRVERCEELK